MPAGKSLLLSLRNVYETLYICAPTVVDAVRGTTSREVFDGRLAAWSEKVIANTEMKVSVRGREHIDPNATYLIMSNHQSHYDIAVIYYVLGSHMRMVAKSELFKLPIFGRAMTISGFISVDRGNRKSAISSLENAKARIAEGVPIWIAPEGTRSPTGQLQKFKKGAFVLAVATGAPILPVSISGTRDVLPSKGMRSRRGCEVSVVIHPPIDPKKYADLDAKAARDKLSEDVRAAVASGLPKGGA